VLYPGTQGKSCSLVASRLRRTWWWIRGLGVPIGLIHTIKIRIYNVFIFSKVL